MSRRLVLSLALLSCLVASARAYDLDPSVSGYAFFINADDTRTELITSGVVTPGGGRAYDFHQFGNNGALCTTYTGQVDWLCASSSASIDINRQPVVTTTYVGTSTFIQMKAQVHVDYRNANATSAKIWARATLGIPLACHGVVAPVVGGLSVLFRLDGDYSVSVSDPLVPVTAPRPFSDCTAGTVCSIKVPTFHCPDQGSFTSFTIDLFPVIGVGDTAEQGYSLLGVSDYSHTFTLEGMDLLDDQGNPLPGVRLVVPGDGGALNEVFLTGAEAAEVDAQSTTTTTTIDGTSTTTTIDGTITTTTIDGTITTTTTSPGATTSTTAPACASADLAAAGCRCALGPAAGCEGVMLSKPVDKGVSGLCAKIAKATSASGKKQRRFAKQAVALAKKTLRAVNGKKGNAMSGACREGLRGFLQATQTDAATATH